MQQKTLLRVENLIKDFDVTRGFTRKKIGRIRAVNDVSFSIDRGEILGLVGESGCGKTTTGRCILRAIEPTSGRVFYDLHNIGPLDIMSLSCSGLKDMWKQIRLVFQDAFALSLHHTPCRRGMVCSAGFTALSVAVVIGWGPKF